jgi:hypothetical protein
VRAARKEAGVLPAFKRVDTCAAEFAAETPYLYSSYDGNDESRPSSAKKVRRPAPGPERRGPAWAAPTAGAAPARAAFACPPLAAARRLPSAGD